MNGQLGAGKPPVMWQDVFVPYFPHHVVSCHVTSLTGPSSTSASSTTVGPPAVDDDADDVEGATEDVGPPTAVILMRIENLASTA